MGKQRVGEVWKAVQVVRGVYGLVTSGVDLAVRVDAAELDVAGLETALVGLKLEVKPRQEGLKWWCLEKVQERELWKVPELIGSFGMTAVGS